MNPLPFEPLIKPFLDLGTDVNIFWNIISFLFLIGFSIYALFALIVIRQVFLMASTFRTTAGLVLKLIAFLHFFFAVGMLFLAFAVLF
jgi:Family of unknown function (DUF5657)